MFWLFEMWLEFSNVFYFQELFSPRSRRFFIKNFPTSLAMRLKAFICSSATLNKTESAQTQMQSQAHPWRLAATWKQSTLIASRLARNVKAAASLQFAHRSNTFRQIASATSRVDSKNIFPQALDCLCKFDEITNYSSLPLKTSKLFS